MKTVLLMRHAKSSWSDLSLEDFQRPLASRGREAAPRMAGYIRDQGLTPDYVICSAAVRAVETWELMAPLFERDIPMESDEGLFHAGPYALLDALRRCPEDSDRLLLIAHSPGIENLAIALSGPGFDRQAYGRLCAKFPTAALAAIEFESDSRRTLGENGGRLTRFVTPRDLV